MSGVLVISAPVNGDPLDSGAKELLGAGRRLADGTGAELSIALLGPDTGNAAGEAGDYGADRILTVEHEALDPYQSEAYLEAAQAAVEQAGASLVLLSGNGVGKDLGPRLAYRLEAGFVNDCVDFELENGDVFFTRPVFGGKAMATMEVNSDRKVAAIRPKAIEPAEAGAGEAADIEAVAVDLDAASLPSRFLEAVESDDGDINLEDASVVVSGGRGMGGPEPFTGELAELADILDGTVGASLAAVDEGWVTQARQVGQTGTVVSPELYIAVGISGAMQHMAGCSGSKYIVAINKDPDAPIFDKANFGVVEDYKNVLPTLLETCQELMQ